LQAREPPASGSALPKRAAGASDQSCERAKKLNFKLHHTRLTREKRTNEKKTSVFQRPASGNA
jgi:hypothetical protein